LQRARATMTTAELDPEPSGRVDAAHEALLADYVDAFERYDISRLVGLLREDAIQSMPPFALWLQGRESIGAWFLGPGSGCRGSRLIPTSANGWPAFGQYRVDPAGGFAPWALQVLQISGGQIIGYHAFLDTALFTVFGLPAHLNPDASAEETIGAA
jgi:RNA polymerase sigma-70 factor (ECF subfamily)